jgi:hypothetical protein
MIYVKMTNFGTKVSLFTMHVLVFFCTGHKEYMLFTKLYLTT